MPRRVRNDELALGCGEVAVGYVNGDALLAFGLQAVGDERQINLSALALCAARLTERFKLVDHERFAVKEQAADKRAFAVVNAAAGDEAERACVGGGDGVLCFHFVFSVRRALTVVRKYA